MEVINVLGKPCPIPVIEARKALARTGAEGVVIQVDNIIAVQNLEKMAKGYGYGFSFTEKAADLFEATIISGENAPAPNSPVQAVQNTATASASVVLISRSTMGEGAEELGKILMKAFIYSLTELAVAPAHVIFLNSGAFLTSAGSNTIEDLKLLEQTGTKILTCGTCVNYYGLQGKLAVGSIANMYEITEIMASSPGVINI